MSKIAVVGSGAFGTALALALSRDGDAVTLWSRDADDARRMQDQRRTGRRLPDHTLPETLSVTADLPDADIALLAVPAQRQRDFLTDHGHALSGRTLISCAKGVEQETGLGPADVIADLVPRSRPGILTGPSFAADIAKGLPTALVLAMEADGEAVQTALTRPALRIYRTTDVTGAQLGGALKNVIAIAAGIATGAGLGDSARASVISRGFAEISRYAAAKGAETDTLQGLSGLGDLVLTCSSEKSRNYSAGITLGGGQTLNPDITIEGIATARAVSLEARKLGLDMPLTDTVARIVTGELDIPRAIATLLARPVGKE